MFDADGNYRIGLYLSDKEASLSFNDASGSPLVAISSQQGSESLLIRNSNGAYSIGVDESGPSWFSQDADGNRFPP